MTITDQQLEKRRHQLGSSDAATAAGTSPYQTIRDLWMVKTGRSEPEDISEKNAVQNGIAAEPAILARFYADTGCKVIDDQAAETIHPDRPWLVSHPDAIVDLGNGPEPVDAKLRHMSDDWGPAMSDVLPFNEICQAYHQAICMGSKRAHIAAWLHGWFGLEYRRYVVTIERDIADGLLKLWDRFWANVTEDTDPGGRVGLRSLMLRKSWSHEAIRIEPDEIARYKALSARETRAKKAKDESKRRLLDSLGDAQFGVCEYDDRATAVGMFAGRFGIRAADGKIAPSTLERLGFEPEMQGEK